MDKNKMKLKGYRYLAGIEERNILEFSKRNSMDGTLESKLFIYDRINLDVLSETDLMHIFLTENQMYELSDEELKLLMDEIIDKILLLNPSLLNKKIILNSEKKDLSDSSENNYNEKNESMKEFVNLLKDETINDKYLNYKETIDKCLKAKK